MGFGTEILFIGILGVMLLGPKRLPAILGHIARAKAQLENATHNLKAELEAELEPNATAATPPISTNAP